MAMDGAPGGWHHVDEGPFAGWLTWPDDPFETVTGPFYFQADGDGGARGAFVPEGTHMNGHGIIHGGALLTFADTMAGTTLQLALDGQLSVTVTLNSEFIAPGGPDAPVEATGRVVRATRSLAFVQGLLVQNEQPILTFSSVLKKVDPR